MDWLGGAQYLRHLQHDYHSLSDIQEDTVMGTSVEHARAYDMANGGWI